MQAIIIDPDQELRLKDVPTPIQTAFEVLIRVEAAGLNRADLVQRAGHYPPPPGASDVLGLEVVGRIEAIGADVSHYKVGDRVCALLPGGGYAQYAVADEGSILPVPEDMEATQACCFPEAVFTVWANVFDRARFAKGEAFLCHGGTSGIGVVAIQMARIMGASNVYATAGTDEKCALATSLGADLAINYRKEDFVTLVSESGGVDVILDMVGGEYVQRNIESCRTDGRIINIAYMNGFDAQVNFLPVLIKRLSLMATTLRARSAQEKRRLRDALELAIWPHVLNGNIRPVLDSSYDLTDANAAHARMKSGKHSGKIVLRVP